MKKYFFYLLSTLVLFACNGEEKKRKTEVFEIREIGELSTTEYVFSKVLKIDDKGEWYKMGNRRILISCKAKVKAGVDLSAIQNEDIKINGDNITILLPKAKLTSFNMDPNSVKTEMVEVSGMRSSFSQEEKNKILQMGEKSIREGMLETGIYAEAQKNAIAFVKDFYQQMGFVNVTVTNKKDNER